MTYYLSLPLHLGIAAQLEKLAPETPALTSTRPGDTFDHAGVVYRIMGRSERLAGERELGVSVFLCIWGTTGVQRMVD
jgi:hypothetical protein